MQLNPALGLDPHLVRHTANMCTHAVVSKYGCIQRQLNPTHSTGSELASANTLRPHMHLQPCSCIYMELKATAVE